MIWEYDYFFLSIISPRLLFPSFSFINSLKPLYMHLPRIRSIIHFELNQWLHVWFGLQIESDALLPSATNWNQKNLLPRLDCVRYFWNNHVQRIFSTPWSIHSILRMQHIGQRFVRTHKNLKVLKNSGALPYCEELEMNYIHQFIFF